MNNISIIAAVRSTDDAIGCNGKLLYSIDEDLKFFKDKTIGNIVVFGSSTYINLPKKPLKNRENYVLSKKNVDYGVPSLKSLQEVIELSKKNPDKKVFICGGESVYSHFLDYADEIYLTIIKTNDEKEADTFFPKMNPLDWKLVSVHADKENLNHEYPHFFCRYERQHKESE